MDLIAAGNIDSENIRDQTDRIISGYEDTGDKMALYEQVLDEAAILHNFNSEANDLKANIKEFTREMKAMAVEQSFEGAQRQVTALLTISNDIGRLEAKVELLRSLGAELESKFPAMRADIQQRLADIGERMEKMKKINAERLELARFLRALYKLKQVRSGVVLVAVETVAIVGNSLKKRSQDSGLGRQSFGFEFWFLLRVFHFCCSARISSSIGPTANHKR